MPPLRFQIQRLTCKLEFWEKLDAISEYNWTEKKKRHIILLKRCQSVSCNNYKSFSETVEFTLGGENVFILNTAK